MSKHVIGEVCANPDTRPRPCAVCREDVARRADGCPRVPFVHRWGPQEHGYKDANTLAADSDPGRPCTTCGDPADMHRWHDDITHTLDS